MSAAALPILLFNDECGVCRRIARWVTKSAHGRAGAPSIEVRAIGDDPAALQRLSPGLDIWDAYATIHLLMPDAPTKVGGEAVAEVLRRVPSVRWFAWSFAVSVFGFRPFQQILNLAYAVLSDVRPIFGCDSCGTPPVWMRPFAWVMKKLKHHAEPTRTTARLARGASPVHHF